MHNKVIIFLFVIKIQLRDTNTNPEDIWLDIKKEDDEAGNYFLQITIVFKIWLYMFTIFCLLTGMEDTLEEDQKDDLDDSECVEEINGDRSILAEAYRVIDEAGPEGLSAHLLGIYLLEI